MSDNAEEITKLLKEEITNDPCNFGYKDMKAAQVAYNIMRTYYASPGSGEVVSESAPTKIVMEPRIRQLEALAKYTGQPIVIEAEDVVNLRG